MKKISFLLACSFVMLFSNSCHKDDEQDNTISGCRDPKSLSYNPYATRDSGVCLYSTVTFYHKYIGINPCSPAAPCPIGIVFTEVFINGESIGTIQGYPGANYQPNPPADCAASNTLTYQFQNSTPINWTSEVHYQDGQIINGSGTISPDQSVSCIKINAMVAE